MPRYTKPRKTWMYTNAFKIKAVKLTLQDGFKVKQVAEALDIHPFMLSRWRKEYRDGKLKGAIGRRVSVTTKKKTPSSKQISDYERLKRENAKLKEENDLLKKWQRYLAEQHQNDLDSSKDTDT
jgi:transposase